MKKTLDKGTIGKIIGVLVVAVIGIAKALGVDIPLPI